MEHSGSRQQRSQVRHEGSRTPGVRSLVSAEVDLVRKRSERVLGIAPESRANVWSAAWEKKPNIHHRSGATRECLVDFGRLGRWLAFLLIAVSFSNTIISQTITVSVSPGVASVATGGSRSVSATAQNDSTNEGVTWVLTGDGTSESAPGCSGSTCGTLTNVGTFSVPYVAPSTVPSPATVTLPAYSKASNTSSSSVNIVVTSGSLNVWISPTGA